MEKTSTSNIKLIFLNILVTIVSLVAAICLLFTPWLDLRIQVSGEKIAELLNEKETESNYAVETSEQKDPLMAMLTEELAPMQFDIPVNVYPMKLVEAATGSQQELENFFNSLLGKNGAADFLKGFINDLTPVVLKATVHVTIETAVEEALTQAGAELTPEQREQIEGYKESATNIVTELLEEEVDTEAVKADFSQLVNQIAEDCGEDAPDSEQLNEIFDAIVEQGINEEGKFDLLFLLSNYDITSIESSLNGGSADSSENNGSDSETVYTAHSTNNRSDDLLFAPFASPTAQAVADGSESSDGSSSEGESENVNKLNEMLALLENPGGALVQQLSESGDFEQTLNTLHIVFWVVFLVVAAIPAFFWLLLALNACFAIFKRKPVRVWYVCLFCLWSGLGILLANVGLSYLPQILPEMAEPLSVFSSLKILGSGIVTGICWLVVFVCSFFYRGIRKRMQAAYNADGTDSANASKPQNKKQNASLQKKEANRKISKEEIVDLGWEEED